MLVPVGVLTKQYCFRSWNWSNTFEAKAHHFWWCPALASHVSNMPKRFMQTVRNLPENVDSYLLSTHLMLVWFSSIADLSYTARKYWWGMTCSSIWIHFYMHVSSNGEPKKPKNHEFPSWTCHVSEDFGASLTISRTTWFPPHRSTSALRNRSICSLPASLGWENLQETNAEECQIQGCPPVCSNISGSEIPTNGGFNGKFIFFGSFS